jgi:hypothetical protein
LCLRGLDDCHVANVSFCAPHLKATLSVALKLAART